MLVPPDPTPPPGSALRAWLDRHAEAVSAARAEVGREDRVEEAEILALHAQLDALPNPVLEALAERLRSICRTAGLGESSAHFVSGEGLGRVASRLRSGYRLRDAVLGAVYDGTDHADALLLSKELSNEFWAMISGLLIRMAGARPQTGTDEVQSAIASVLGQEREVEFRTLGEFISYLRTRMSWKGRNGDRRQRPFQHIEPQAVDQMAKTGPGPATLAAEASVVERIKSYIARLNERDQYLITARLDRVPMEEQAERQGLSLEACRKASQRAWTRLREIVKFGPDGGSTGGAA
jgi:DNA-directed RNA polymerase specialized sigma24 family protein